MAFFKLAVSLGGMESWLTEEARREIGITPQNYKARFDAFSCLSKRRALSRSAGEEEHQ
jgi:hypothetical protein